MAMRRKDQTKRETKTKTSTHIHIYEGKGKTMMIEDKENYLPF